jgi:phage-related protein
MPATVQDEFGSALNKAQWGFSPANEKPWKGDDSGVYELVERFDGDTYRAVYVVRFAEALYVLHCFQKKSNRGIKTSLQDNQLVSRRLKAAEAHRTKHYGGDRN